MFTHLAVWSLLAGVYLLPAFIGAVRRVRNLGSLTVINVGLGWTVAGWVVALAMAVRDKPQDAM